MQATTYWGGKPKRNKAGISKKNRKTGADIINADGDGIVINSDDSDSGGNAESSESSQSEEAARKSKEEEMRQKLLKLTLPILPTIDWPKSHGIFAIDTEEFRYHWHWIACFR